MLHAVVLRLTRNRADADDVVQEAFLSAYKHWSEFRGESQPCTWLHSIAVRAALRRGRRETRRRDVAREYAQAMPFMQSRLAAADFPSASLEARELRTDARQRVDAAMRDVAEPFRSALVLKEIAGMSVDDVAMVLGVKAATVKTRLHRGRLLEVAEQTNESNMRPHIFCGQIQVRPSGITATVVYHNQFPLKGVVEQCGLYGLNQITGKFLFVVHRYNN